MKQVFKRGLLLVLALLLAFGQTALAQEAPAAADVPSAASFLEAKKAGGNIAQEQEFYLGIAWELTQKLGELARDESYLLLMGGIESTWIDAFRQNDVADPSSAWLLQLAPETGLRAIVGGASGMAMSDVAWEHTYAGVPGMMVSQNNSKLGVDAIATASMLSYTRTYAMPDGFEPCAVALVLENAVSLVGFSRTGEDSITAMAQPMFCPEGCTPGELLNDVQLIIFAPNKVQLF